MSVEVISGSQMISLSYIEAAARGDEESMEVIVKAIGEKGLIDALSDLTLILAATLIPCHTGEEVEHPEDLLDGITSVLASVRETFQDHS